jgi:hypothetical protein
MMITASDFTGGIKAIPSDTINIPGPESKYDGVSTAVAANKLTDANAGLQGGFLVVRDAANGTVTNQGVQVGDVVYNMSAARPGVAYVTAVDSATTLSLSTPIFLNAGTNRDGYRIYRGRGVNLSTAWGYKLVVADVTNQTISSFASGTDSGGAQAIVPTGGGTYSGNATFTMTVAGGAGVATVQQVTVATTGTLSEVDLIGKTVIFSAADINGINPGTGTGTGTCTFTITGVNQTYTPESYDVGNATPFQLYCGGTTAAPPLACDVYVTTIDGDFVFFEGVQPGEILPVAICRVNVGAAAATANGNVNTLTTATARFVALT